MADLHHDGMTHHGSGHHGTGQWPASPAGTRPRVVVSTDIGGTDPDDFQSMVHLLVESDRIDLEGLISSPYGDGRVDDIHAVIDCYTQDWPNLRSWSQDYPSPDHLRSIVAQGVVDAITPAGVADPTPGSQLIVDRARADDPRPLDVLVWGGIDDVAQAVHDADDIVERIRVHYIGGPNKMWCVDAYHYLERNHPDLRIIESNSTYRGFWLTGGPDDRQLNTDFVAEHVDGHGALGSFFARQLQGLKMGDTPTVTWVLHGLMTGRFDPTLPSWGGQYVPMWDGRLTVLDRFGTADDIVEAHGVVEFRVPVPDGYGSDDRARIVVNGRTQGPFAQGWLEDDRLCFRWSPRDPGRASFVVQSTHTDLDGREGGFLAVRPERWRVPSTRLVNWFGDDHSEANALGEFPGARTISRWRDEFLADFAQRMDRCLTPNAERP